MCEVMVMARRLRDRVISAPLFRPSNSIAGVRPPEDLSTLSELLPTAADHTGARCAWLAEDAVGRPRVVELPPACPPVSVVIPTLNEARNLAYLLPTLAGAVHEIILVDGHSTDDTIAVAQSLLPNIHIVTQTGRGKGDALHCGFKAATGKIIVTLDADGSADPFEIPRFIRALLDGADFAKGSRFARGSANELAGSSDITRLRALGNAALSGVVNVLFGTRFTDLCYGYNAFWTDCLAHFEVDATGFEVETLLSLRACAAHLKMVEVPSYEHPRIYGRSNLHAVPDGWRVLKTILRERAIARSLTTSMKQSLFARWIARESTSVRASLQARFPATFRWFVEDVCQGVLPYCVSIRDLMHAKPWSGWAKRAASLWERLRAAATAEIAEIPAPMHEDTRDAPPEEFEA
jgi:hypothetical protein